MRILALTNNKDFCMKIPQHIFYFTLTKDEIQQNTYYYQECLD